MHKTELIDAIKEELGDELSKKDIDRVIEAGVKAAKEEVAKGGSVTIVGFGRLDRRYHAKHVGRNPQTGKTMEVPAQYSAGFKPGRAFKAMLNK